MASKKFLELKEFTDEELVNELVATEAAYQSLEFDHAISTACASIINSDTTFLMRSLSRSVSTSWM